MKKLLLIALGFCLSFTALSQGTIKGRIIDSTSKQPLGLATVTVFKASDTTLITYRLSTPEGDFKVPGLPLNIECRVVISFSGYNVHRQTFTLTTGKETLELDTIRLAPDSKSLDEVMVVAERPPVSVRKDTIEFNATAFKTLPTALVEDLLKKLPGVQIDADGNIVVNGKRVNRILVDGKEFFGNDPKMATRNLPANMIDKVQVSEDKDEAELNPDKPKGEIGQVINLKLKKGVKKGWFGKAYAGAGTDELYEAGSIINLFKDTMQVSLLGFTNNLNRAGFGFNDIRSLGGFDRSGINMLMINGNGGINVNGISFGGTGEGINRSTGAGFNMNNVLRNGFTLNTQYFFGKTRNDITELNNRQQFLGDTIFNTRTTRDEILETKSHRLGLGLKGKIDSLSRFEFRPNLVFSNQESRRLTDIVNADNFNGLLSTADNTQLVSGKDVSYNHSLLYFKNFRKKGRTLNIAQSLNFGRFDNDQTNDVLYTFFDPTDTVNTRLDQLRDRQQSNLNAVLNANFTEPISKEFSLRAGYSGTFFKTKDDLSTFNKSNGGTKYDVLNPLLSNAFNRTSWRNSLSAGINWKRKAFSVTAMASWLSMDIYNTFQKGGEVNQHFKYILPSLNINWKELNFGYNVNVTPPGANDVQPVPDNSNPLYIQYGDPNLKPATAHNLHLNFFKSIPQKTLFVSAYLNANMRENAITRARTLNPDGSQFTIPVNINGAYDLYTNFNINKQYKLKKNFQFSIGGGWNIDFNRNFLIVNDRKGYAKQFGLRPQANASINWKDIIEWNINHSRGWGKSRYESDDFTDLDVTTHYTNTELVIRWPKNIVWETSLVYRYNSQVAPGIQKTSALLNGGVTFLFLKEQKGQLKLSAFDLLNQNINIYRYTSENSVIDRQINILQRYFLLTFTYNIRNFKAGKVGGSERFFRF
ncbi:MAG TPA: outer membrane beta-barrel protein [Chitinophagaceae bacterium]|nr:outer membrane beta-barrel protein [Chitinophagaceae bacterium]